MKFKKAQGEVSGLVMLIGFLIIIYVLMMPPCDKCELLDSVCPEYCLSESYEGILLSVSPGSFSNEGQTQINHNFESMNFFTRAEPEIKSLSKDLEVSKSWFGSLDRTFSFKLEDLEDLDSSYISFLVMEAKGELYVYLNDKQVFFDKAKEGNLVKVPLPLEYLINENKLNIYTNPPGILFWVKNKYLLKDLELTTNFVKINSIEEKIFQIGDLEKEKLEDSVLEYSVYCVENVEEVSNFRIYLNEMQLSSENLSCLSQDKKLQINSSNFIVGQNKFRFILDHGNFLISSVELANYLDGPTSLDYGFEVYSKYEKQFNVHFDSPSQDLKSFQIMLNGHIFDIVFEGVNYSQDITNFIKVGKNNIEIISGANLDIDKLEVKYN